MDIWKNFNHHYADLYRFARRMLCHHESAEDVTQEAMLKLARLTKAHIGEPVAILIDGRVVSAPKIMDEITGGRANIVGVFTAEEARSIAEGILVR